MKKDLILLILLIAILLDSNIVYADKIQIDDVWQYEDQDGNVYMENALDVIQLSWSSTVISSVYVNTTRGFIFPYNHFIEHTISGEGLSANVSLDLDPQINGLYLTQEGGIPLRPSGDFIGTITVMIENHEVNETEVFVFDVNNTKFVIANEDPSIALTSTSSIKYTLGVDLLQVNEVVPSESVNIVNIQYEVGYIISSDSEVSASTKNFTFTKEFEGFHFEFTQSNQTTPGRSYTFHKTIFQNGRFNYEISFSDGIHDSTISYGDTPPSEEFNAFEDEATLMTFEKGINLPTYIRETVPAKIHGLLSLQQSQTVLEYFLVNGKSENSDAGLLLSPFNSLLILIFIPIKKRFGLNPVS